MEWEIEYYDGKVQQVITKWPTGLRAVYTRITERIIQFGPNLGMPYTRSLGRGLLEIRIKGREGISRAFFCTMVGRKVIILHAFIKKTTKTPKKELGIARIRLSMVKDENT